MHKISGQDASVLSLIVQMLHKKWHASRLKRRIKGKRALEIANCLLGNKGNYDASIVQTMKSIKNWAKTN